MIKTLTNLDGYRTGMRGFPQLHEETAWYATEDDRVLGIIVRDRIDDDYGSVVLTRATEWEDAFLTNLSTPPGVYRCVDMNTSHPSVAEAVEALHQAMHAALEEAP
jgi:hypothetical protein